MQLQNMLKQKIGWLESKGDSGGIAISSRIRVARNLNRIPFPQKASRGEQEESFKKIKAACEQIAYFKGAPILNLQEFDRVDRQFLLERHLISYEHSRGDGVRGLVIGDKELLSLMINEEDHLRLQGIQPGLELQQAWDILKQIDEQMDKKVDYAFSPDIGYLTACPTNTGTGMRASVLMHLPALVMNEEINKVLQALNKIGMVARGLYGEGTKVMGDLFQISNQVTLGPNEEGIIDNLERVVKQVINYEIKGRKTLFKENKEKVMDVVYRAYGVLMNARQISFAETMEFLSKVRLGIYFDLHLNTKLDILNELTILTQPAHLQESVGKELTPSKRDFIRADMIRRKLKSEK
ncbi:protein arginine kinase [bacterium]|nr:protein arginine kinase [bacterium]NIN92208.1 protein arginine kinase [bacterium]NIO73327.1 protein arginine kinase [bacterium]